MTIAIRLIKDALRPVSRHQTVAVRTMVVVAAAALLAAACGTRLPNSAFQQLQANGRNAAAGGAGDTGDNGITGTGDNGAATAGNGATNGSGGPSATAGGGAGGAAGAAGPAGGGPGGPNQASDVGVTPTSVTIGNVTGVNGFLGPEAFGTTLHGLEAFVAYTNAHGGVHGRKLVLKTCDDQQDATQNLVCTQKLVQQDKVFGFLANNSLSPQPSASYEAKQGVPDLGLPLDNGYAKYPNMFSLYGNQYPRDGNQVGDHGQNWQDTAIYRFFHQKVGASKAAVFFYNQTISQSQAKVIEQLARAEGFQIVYESGGSQGENFSGPSWDTDVQQMKAKGADIIFDTVDVNANQKICAAIDRYQVTSQIKAKVTTVEGWTQDVGSPAWSTGCRNLIYGWDRADTYSDTGNPAIKQFLDGFNAYEKPQGHPLAQWSVDGWLAGQMLVDYLNDAGPAPTRKGFMQWLDNIKPYTYDAHGLVSNSDTTWAAAPHPQNRSRCWVIAQWQDSAGTFVNRGGSPFYCATTSEVAAPFTADGS